VASRERLICASAELVDGGDGVRFEVARAGESLPAFVVRWREKPFAYINECAHQTTELDWNAGDFFDESKLYLMCATHGAIYERTADSALAAPAMVRDSPRSRFASVTAAFFAPRTIS
jgi:nitrite reductase/ring-hydroxylating ferredoxin subunit